MYLPLVDLQRKIFFTYVLVHSGEMSVIFLLLYTGDFILHMVYVFSERTIICFPSGCFQIESLIRTCKSILCIYEIQCLPCKSSKDAFILFYFFWKAVCFGPEIILVLYLSIFFTFFETKY